MLGYLKSACFDTVLLFERYVVMYQGAVEFHCHKQFPSFLFRAEDAMQPQVSKNKVIET